MARKINFAAAQTGKGRYQEISAALQKQLSDDLPYKSPRVPPAVPKPERAGSPEVALSRDTPNADPKTGVNLAITGKKG